MLKAVLVLIGAGLIVIGVLGLVYGEFSYTAETHEADLKIAKLELKEKEKVNIPTWAGVTSIAVGAAVLFAGAKRKG